MRQVGAVDIGGTKIAVGIVREDRTILHQSECPTDPKDGFQSAVHRIEQMLQQGIAQRGTVSGVGIACPGPLDPFTGVIGDVGTLPGWENGHHYLGLGLANLVTLFVPDVICLGGGVMRSSDLFLDDVRTMVRTLCTQVPAEDTRITLSSLGYDAGLLGAAQAWFLRAAHESTHLRK